MNICPVELLISVEYLEYVGYYKAVVRVKERTDAVCLLGDEYYRDIGNEFEPFDFHTHIFMLPINKLALYGKYSIILSSRRSSSIYFKQNEKAVLDIEFDPLYIVDMSTALTRADRGLSYEKTLMSTDSSGFGYSTELYRTADGQPVRTYLFTVDMKNFGFIAGTPFGNEKFEANKIETAMDEVIGAKKRGYSIAAAVNADFFNMFGDCKPSGLCVSRGKTVVNEMTERPFFAITKSGEAVISNTHKIPASELSEAVGGKQIIVHNGAVNDIAQIEPFGETPHPRTAVGIRKDGTVIAMVVDGRRPAWSNGATLSELARLMINHGAVTALNLDGGGSSTFIVDTPDGLTMLNHPADLHRPEEDLIRPLFNTLIAIRL